MNNKVLTEQAFNRFVLNYYRADQAELTFLYNCYKEMLGLITAHVASEKEIMLEPLNNGVLILYLLHDYVYRQNLENVQLYNLADDEIFMSRFLNTVIDKYTSLTSFKYEHDKLLSRYSMPVSSLTLYLNFILITLKNLSIEHEHSILLKLLQKAFLYVETSLGLLTNGFESEAISLWRSLHELEAILILLTDENVLKVYTRHLQYSAAFNKLLPKEEGDAIFVEIKSEMKKLGLKSKDTKRFIEYGFIRAHKNFSAENNLTFKYGLQKLAGLERYHQDYQLASELAHSSPLLLLQSKRHLTVTVLTLLYETFLRLETIFDEFYLATAVPETEPYYTEVRSRYLNDIIAILNREKLNLNKPSN